MADPITFTQLVKFFMALQSVANSLPPPNQTQGSPAPPEQAVVMPQSAAEIGQLVLKCYHPTGRFKSIRLIEQPWRSGVANYRARQAVLVQINWEGKFLRTRYRLTVGVVERDGYLRAPVIEDSAVLPPSDRCAFKDWIKLRTSEPVRSASAQTAAAPSAGPDLNSARAEIEALLDAASAVALASEKLPDGKEAVPADLISELTKRALAARAAMGR